MMFAMHTLHSNKSQMTRGAIAITCLCLVFRLTSSAKPPSTYDACPFDLKDSSGWDIVELHKEELQTTYGVPKHSFGYKMLTKEPTGFIDKGSEATKILGTVFEPFLYKLNSTKPEIPVLRSCSQDNWREKLEITTLHGDPVDSARGKVPKGPDCLQQDCGCYLRYSDACPVSGYKTFFLPIPWWWCYFECRVVIGRANTSG